MNCRRFSDLLFSGAEFIPAAKPKRNAKSCEVIDQKLHFAYTLFGASQWNGISGGVMLSTYRAILRGKILEWLSEQPKNLPTNQAVSVYVTILDEPLPVVKKQQGRRMAAALEKLAKLSSSVHTVDALQWEREIRQERKLPARESDN